MLGSVGKVRTAGRHKGLKQVWLRALEAATEVHKARERMKAGCASQEASEAGA